MGQCCIQRVATAVRGDSAAYRGDSAAYRVWLQQLRGYSAAYRGWLQQLEGTVLHTEGGYSS